MNLPRPVSSKAFHHECARGSMLADRLFWLTAKAIFLRKLRERLGFPWNLTYIVAIYLGILCVTSCFEPKLEVFSIRNQARTEDGEPLPGVRIVENGKSHGQTDEAGILFLQIRGFIGQKITLSAVCPEGYDRSSKSRTISLQYLNGFNNERILSGPEVSWRCSSLVQTTALVIRASTQPLAPSKNKLTNGGLGLGTRPRKNPRNSSKTPAVFPAGAPAMERLGRDPSRQFHSYRVPNLPIAIDGKPVARTSADGIAHLLLKKPVGSHFLVSIDTSKYPDLRPQNPQRLFRIKEGTAILIFDQRLTMAPKRKKRRKSKSAVERHIPYKIRD